MTNHETFSDVVTVMKNADPVPSRQSEIAAIAATKSLHIGLTIHRRKLDSGWLPLLERYFPNAPFSRYLSTYFVGWYFVTKLLFIATALFNLWIMKSVIAFPSDGYYRFYDEVLVNVFNEASWELSLYFSITNVCVNKEVVVLASKNTFMSQCIVQQNLYNRFIISFMAFWSIFVVVVLTVGLCVWVKRICFYGARRQYVKKLLKNVNLINHKTMDKTERMILFEFINEYLRYDGVFMLHMMSMKIGEGLVSRMTGLLWIDFRNHYNNNISKLKC